MSRTTPVARPVAVLRRIGRTRLAAIVVVAAIALVNILPSSGGPLTPASDTAVDTWLDAEIGDAGYPGASIAVIRDGHIEHVHVVGTADSAGRPVTTGANRPIATTTSAPPASVSRPGRGTPRGGTVAVVVDTSAGEV